MSPFDPRGGCLLLSVCVGVLALELFRGLVEISLKGCER